MESKLAPCKKKPSAKTTVCVFLLNRGAFPEIRVFTAEATREDFHSEGSDKFKCLSHVDYAAYTAVQAFLSDVCAGALTLLPKEKSR